jgi:hypothetical protein
MNKMPSISNFKQLIQSVRKTAQFQGYDVDGNPVMDRNVKYPIVKARGTIKCHGTNSGAAYNEKDGLWAQSKNHKITPQKDNAGFASFVEFKKDDILNMILNIKNTFNIDTQTHTITVFGEWAGPGIQKGVGISQIPEKCWFIFGIRITDETNEEKESYWFTDEQLDSFFIAPAMTDRIYALNRFKTYDVEIDFNQPELANNIIFDMIQEVENECPVAKYFGVSGIGEGIVFKFEYKDTIHKMKAKGDKHSVSKVKKHKKVDDKEIQKCMDLAEKVTPAWRLEQMYNETFDTLNGGEGDIKRTGEYIKSVINDIVKEEMETIAEEGIEFKKITKFISNIAKDYMFARMDEEIK